MKYELRSAALAITMVFGIASVAHASQQPAETGQRQMPRAGQNTGQSPMMGQPGQAPMMNNAQMPQGMAGMMERCRRMMSRTAGEQGVMPPMQQQRQ